MEKESVKKFDLEAAFKALDEIEIPQTKGKKGTSKHSKKPRKSNLTKESNPKSSNRSETISTDDGRNEDGFFTDKKTRVCARIKHFQSVNAAQTLFF